MIYNFTDREHWSDEIDNVRARFGAKDLVIGPGYGSFRTMVVVHEIQPEAEHDAIEHKGIFWDVDEAVAYAEDRHERTHGYVKHEI
jgi:hypothetical protein